MDVEIHPLFWFFMNSNIEKIIDKAFSDASISDLYVCIGNYETGDILYEYEKHNNADRKYFDLASLTKMLVGYDLFYKSGIDSNSTLDEFLPEFSSFPNLQKIKVLSLLTHESGLKPWKNFWIKNLESSFSSYQKRHEKILSLFLRYDEKDLLQDSSEYLYSDLNYILLGIIIERAANRSLKDIVNKKDYFFLETPRDNSKQFVDYGYCALRKKQIQGFVHDENCFSFSGISAHAGLFSSSNALKDQLQEFLNCHHKRLVNIQSNYPTRGGLQFQDSGDLLFGRIALGHLGFVGNDIWFDPSSSKFFILLSNRVKYGRLSSFMKDFRNNLYKEFSTEI